MTFKDILLHVDSYPETTPRGPIEEAVALAASFDAKLSALGVHIKINASTNILAELLIGLSDLAEEAEAQSLTACRATLDHFTKLATDAGVLGEALIARTDLYAVDDYVAERTRTRDLCILPLTSPFDGQRRVAEAVIFASGHPALVFNTGSRLPSRNLDVAVVAWDGGRCAARAVADAMPLWSGHVRCGS